MKTKDENVILSNLHPVMRKVLKTAETIWKDFGREEGVTVTSALDGVHSAGSWHYYGFAVDFRTHYFSGDDMNEVYLTLKDKLPEYDVVLHSTHIHVEIGDNLAQQLGVL